MNASVDALQSRKVSFDQGCLRCHKGHAFHAPNTVGQLECIICHREHHGPSPMPPVENASCLTCHGDPAVLQASAEMGRGLPALLFDYPRADGVRVFQLARPARGYTRVIDSFAGNHPEFRILSEKWRDTNSLQFNHQRHFGPDIPTVNGRKLACADCHVPGPGGNYFQQVNFEKNCQECHSLQFDGANKEMVLPHGDPAHIRAYLRSLPTQYAGLAAKKGIVNGREVEQFVEQQMLQLRRQVRTGEDLEQQVFFNTARKGPAASIGGLQAEGAARFPGCASCHEVTPRPGTAPRITPPVVIDRWLPGGSFNHSRHSVASCVLCHPAPTSTSTSDILLPSKIICATCHKPQGGAPHDCSTCHAYHSPEHEAWVLKAGR